MESVKDATLVCRSQKGDEHAFTQLVRRHEGALSTLIRYRVGNVSDAEDVLQETLLQAWLGIRNLREPDRFSAWLLQIAQNRCRDYLKSSLRRDLPTEAVALEQVIDRFGHVRFRQQAVTDDVTEALEKTPQAERDAAKLFYLGGFTIAEIAKRHRCPEGTVKRRLFHARAHLREVFELDPKRRHQKMSSRKAQPANIELRYTQRPERPSVPYQRPPVVITPVEVKPFAVNCPELRCWSIVPKVGEWALFGNYDPPNWELTELYDMYATRPAKIHGVEGVEIDINLWKAESGWLPSAEKIYGALDEEKARYLAVSIYHNGTALFQTFLDEHFAYDWGEMERRIEDLGRFSLQPDGSLKQSHTGQPLDAYGAGIFSVEVGKRAFTCLRALQVEGDVTNVDAPITASFITQEGRTVLVRHYCHPEKRMITDTGAREGVPTDPQTTVVLDGVTFVHWYDTLTHVAFGL